MTEIKIPDYWTPEQATAMFEFIDDVREAVIIQYRLQIMEQLHSERCAETESSEIIHERDIPF